MAFPTSVNDQITDSVTQTNVKVLSEGISYGYGKLCIKTTSSSLSIATQNAVANQQQSSTVSDTATTLCINKILSNK